MPAASSPSLSGATKKLKIERMMMMMIVVWVTKKTEIRSIVVMIGGDSVFLVMWISKLVLRLMERMIKMSN